MISKKYTIFVNNDMRYYIIVEHNEGDEPRQPKSFMKLDGKPAFNSVGAARKKVPKGYTEKK